MDAPRHASHSGLISVQVVNSLNENEQTRAATLPSYWLHRSNMTFEAAAEVFSTPLPSVFCMHLTAVHGFIGIFHMGAIPSPREGRGLLKQIRDITNVRESFST